MIANDPRATPGAPVGPLSALPTPATPPPTTAVASPRYSLIFAVALSALTLVALIIAFFASDVRQSGSSALPSTWKQVYNADLTAGDTGAWDETQGCDLGAFGLEATASDSTAAICAFQPSVRGDATGAGFYFVATVAPAANVPADVDSILAIGDITGADPTGNSTVQFIVSQDGSYTICSGDCSSTSGALYLHGGLAAWHGNALLPNTIAVKLTPDHSALTFYVNNQQVATVTPQLGPEPALALGATAGSESIYTHASLYTGD